MASIDAPTEIDVRSRKSLSVGSQAESIISVIEAPQPDFSTQVEKMAKQTEDFFEDEEPMPMSARGRPVKRTAKKPLHLDIPQPPTEPLSGQITPDPFKYKQEPDLSSYKFESSPPVEEQAPPLEEFTPIKPPTPSPPKASLPPKSTPGGRRGQPINREPSVGSDRYEEIIVETRKRSLSRPGSRVSSRMGSRTSSQMLGTASRTDSQLDFRPGSQLDSRSQIGEYGQSIGKLDLTSLRASLHNKEIDSLDLDMKIVGKQPQLLDNQVPTDIQEAPATMASQPLPPPKPTPPTIPRQPQIQPQQPPQHMQPKLMALDANQNDTPASLPTAATAPNVNIIQQKRKPPPLREYKPDPLVELFPKNIPTWVVLTYTYSVVLILILLVANSTPDGKLYIHFTALWSIILYFIIDEDQVHFSP